MDGKRVNQALSSVSQGPPAKEGYQWRKCKANSATLRPKRSPAKNTPAAISKLLVMVRAPEKTQPTKVRNAAKTAIRTSSCRSNVIALYGDSNMRALADIR